MDYDVYTINKQEVEKGMRKDTSFSERKLTADEFSQKYWREGEAPYQYHTGSIEDGRDEREQFVFNNIRAIWERMKVNNENNRHQNGKIWEVMLDNKRKIEKLTFIANIALAFVILSTLWNNFSVKEIRQQGGESLPQNGRCSDGE